MMWSQTSLRISCRLQLFIDKWQFAVDRATLHELDWFHEVAVHKLTKTKGKETHLCPHVCNI